jgi:hypothetical protein
MMKRLKTREEIKKRLKELGVSRRGAVGEKHDIATSLMPLWEDLVRDDPDFFTDIDCIELNHALRENSL